MMMSSMFVRVTMRRMMLIMVLMVMVMMVGLFIVVVVLVVRLVLVVNNIDIVQMLYTIIGTDYSVRMMVAVPDRSRDRRRGDDLRMYQRAGPVVAQLQRAAPRPEEPFRAGSHPCRLPLVHLWHRAHRNRNRGTGW